MHCIVCRSDVLFECVNRHSVLRPVMRSVCTNGAILFASSSFNYYVDSTSAHSHSNLLTSCCQSKNRRVRNPQRVWMRASSLCGAFLLIRCRTPFNPAMAKEQLKTHHLLLLSVPVFGQGCAIVLSCLLSAANCDPIMNV